MIMIIMNIAVIKFERLTMLCIELRKRNGLQDVQDVEWYMYLNMRTKLASSACEFFCLYFQINAFVVNVFVFSANASNKRAA